MSDRGPLIIMTQSRSFLSLLFLALGFTLIAAQGVLLSSALFADARVPWLESRILQGGAIGIINKTDGIVSNSELLLRQVEECLKKTCEINTVDTFSYILSHDIRALKAATANEKDTLSITNIPAFELMLVNIKQYEQDGNLAALRADLLRDLPKLQAIQDSLTRYYQNQIHAQKAKYDQVQLGVLLALLACFGLGFYFARGREAQDTKTSSADTMIQATLSWDRGQVEQAIADATLPDQERKFYGKILRTMQEVKELQGRIDLYASLYNIIGYEIRDIANKVKGGIEILTKDMDDNTRVMGYQVVQAAQTLEGLADNFNQLFTAGNTDRSDIVDIYELMADVSVSLSSKVTAKNFVMESYFDRNVPPTIFGNYVNLFWFLLLQLSNEISTKAGRHVVLLMYAHAADSIDKVSICFDVIFTADMDHGLDNLKSVSWEKTQDNHIAADNLMDHLLRDMHHFKVERYKHDAMDKIHVTIEVAPHNYPAYDKPLHGKRILLCGDCVTQIDLMATTLEDYGADIHYAKTPNDIFKSTASGAHYDGVLITDTIKGVKLQSFCKTLHARLVKGRAPVKLFVSVANPAFVYDIHDHVDHIFYRPCEPREFVNTLLQSMNENEAEKEVFEKRAMIVEDDELQQMVLGKILSDCDITYSIKPTGEDALDSFEEERPAMIFMDCIMPGMGGIEATRHIRKLEDLSPNIHPAMIVGASALTGEDKQRECIEAGMNLMIKKPYKREDIEKIIKKFMAAYKAPEDMANV